VLIGRAFVLPNAFKSLRGLIAVPIINTSLTPVGELSFNFIVVTPFAHPNLSKALEKTFWKATMVIGHRGGGADAAAKIGRVHRSHVQENTLLSFVTASSLGAEYVEFGKFLLITI
jgi:glycerophosphodiester phosphodiesterase